MAHKKAGGSGHNGRDSNPKYRGVKVADGQEVLPGGVIIRQCGTHFHPGEGTDIGRDYTIFAITQGVVKFQRVGKTGKRVVVLPKAN
ncbi:MAG TPA: 50S ribosomal protein L27 [Caldisericia bacterium]|jgi:large subunit ribosomal protein L27|nr:50S ribosomal protein L27 [Caldisericia bacterium]MCE5176978.1 50S ribosomal protein L27 [bacterium]NLI40527.1 50S ribosomal protein L27 [Caldisericales bacterium]OQB75152.1 MAG: 50S ribosomal protein L27 [bacterium ADurb.Bin132]NMD14013.1 50S ribosomal protein L27 [Caldisericales bacterium]